MNTNLQIPANKNYHLLFPSLKRRGGYAFLPRLSFFQRSGLVGLLIGIAFTLPLLAPSFVFVQETSPADGYVPCGRDVYKAGDTIPSGKLLSDLKNPCGFDAALELARSIIVGWIMAGVIIATLGFAYAGYLYITAMGSEEKIKHAHSIFVKVIF